jgi:cytochrome c-type biogenesis protein CcmH/NrfF
MAVVACAVLVAAAVAAVWRSFSTPGDEAAAIAADLRCPSCEGETVAQSQSPVAQAMRDVIADQLADGRSGDQVRTWFVDRYGPDILATPPRSGAGHLLWVVPVAVVGAMAALTVRSMRRRGAPRTRSTQRRTGRRKMPVWEITAVGVVALVAVVAVLAPRNGSDRTGGTAADPVTSLAALAQSLANVGRYTEAAQVYQDAVGQRPDDDALRLKLAFALLRAGQPAATAEIAGQVLDRTPDEPQALLLLGLAQRAEGSPEAERTLRRFLSLAPDHAAAPGVRRLLAGG